MPFDEEELDPHGECSAEIARLESSLHEACGKVERLRTALEFYADPSTYHACGFNFDRPTGGFDEDFSDDHGDPNYPYEKPGKLARAVLARDKEDG